MRVLVAGATGALGRRLVPQLVERGHDVTGMTRAQERFDVVRELGATPVAADGLDPEAVAQAVAQTEPEVIVHQMTALRSIDLRKFERTFAVTDRLRTEGTDHLLSAARAVGARRFVAQSYAGWPYPREGSAAKSEDDPLDPHPAAPMRAAHTAIRHVEDAVTGADWTDGIALRYGGFYGPGTGFSLPDGEMVQLLRARKLPVIGNGAGIWSFIHIDDAAAATVAAVEQGRRGIYNVVDDEPAPAAQWIPAAAQAVGAKPPRRVPRWLARILAGEAAVVMMTEVRGALNGKAKRELGWRPAYPSWRQGFADGLR
jgi:nucleoside-diphosphate-sugar epimerase